MQPSDPMPAAPWERHLAVLCVLSPLFGLPVVVPVLTWFLMPLCGARSAFVREVARQQSRFHTVAIAAGALLLAGGIALTPLLPPFGMLALFGVCGLGAWSCRTSWPTFTAARVGRVHPMPFAGLARVLWVVPASRHLPF